MLGYQTREDLLGMGSAEAFYRNAQDREKFIDLMNHKGFVKDHEVEFKRQDGAPIPS